MHLTYHDERHTGDADRPAFGGELTTEEIGSMALRLREIGLAIVPIEPTSKMLEEAWAFALAEDAKGVWKAMIEASQ